MDNYNPKYLTCIDESEKDFFPTPRALADKLLEGAIFVDGDYILEPSAGKGDLLEAIYDHCYRLSPTKLNAKAIGKYHPTEYDFYSSAPEQIPVVDCIELDPQLRSILRDKCQTLTAGIRVENNFGPKYTHYYRAQCAVVHDDFLSFDVPTRYRACIMNGPFSKNPEHILHAIRLFERNGGGEIRCIANASMLQNLCTVTRKEVAALLQKYNAKIEYVEQAFSNAERSTDVTVALITVTIPDLRTYRGTDFSDLSAQLRQAIDPGNGEDADSGQKELTVSDIIDRLVAQYKYQRDVGLRMIDQYVALCKTIPDLANPSSPSQFTIPCIGLNICGCESPNYRRAAEDPDTFWTAQKRAYTSGVRTMFWEILLRKPQLVSSYTEAQKREYLSLVNKLNRYEFSRYNIETIVSDMHRKSIEFIKQAVIDLFDSITATHSWFPECQHSVHYYSGWSSNKAHALNQKVIIPCHLRSSYMDGWDWYSLSREVAEIEKVLCYISGDIIDPSLIQNVIEQARTENKSKNISFRFFDLTMYKKGTIHLKFRDRKLIDKWNIICGKDKNWLPPCYGKVSYSDMSVADRAIVDEFHGNGTPESGCDAYAEVLRSSNDYLTLGASPSLGLLPVPPESPEF